jgi:hypothetical protein
MIGRRIRPLSWVVVLLVVSVALGDEPYGGTAMEGSRDGTAELLACLAGPDVPAGPTCAGSYDVDADSDVDLRDVAAWQATYVGPVVIETQLAGNSLLMYPFFMYVTAFNVNAPVKVGLDPTLYPELVGVTANLYIVADDTEAEWNADPTLTDVRPAGPQTVTFTGNTIQQNTFQVAGANELSADAGTGLGVGYDVVIDVDGDGRLSDGDYADGYRGDAGFYVVADTVALGPLATSVLMYSGGSWLGQRTWYPTDLANLGQLPLVVISHGNGHLYTWYDYLQQHLASYGYVAMSHENDTEPGIETASTTTLTNTDYLLGHLDTIGGGVLLGHVDPHRIIWIGHSRGGEGVVRAYDRLYHGYTPANFTLDDVILVSSIAPTDFLGPTQSNPHSVDYHLIYGSADGDVGGYPDNDIADAFNIYERAQGFRQATYVQGADHNDFNCCGVDDFTGPPGTALGRPEVQCVAKGMFLPLLKHYVEGNIPAKDFLWRQYESFRPIGVAAADTVDLEYKEGAGNFFVDDFQTQPSLTVSSSGGAVSYSVQNPYEGLMNDTDGSFDWNPSDPMNGMTRCRPTDTSKGLVFDWSGIGTPYVEFAIVPAGQDLSGYEFLSLRACQQTRHPQTTVELGDLTFSIALRDAAGTVSRINAGAYGGGVEEPYQRTGYGSGAGWQNEFETARIRLSDFQRNGAGLDLTNIVAVRLAFGFGFGSTRGRIAIDDLQFSTDRNPGGLALRALNVPELVPPGQPTTLQVLIRGRSESYVPGTALLHYRFDGGTYNTLPLLPVGDDVYEATLPAAACGDQPECYFTAEGSIQGLVADPPGAPASVYTIPVGAWSAFYEDWLDTDPGWTISGGLWAFGQPTGGGGQYGGPDPTSGYTGPNVYGYNLDGDYENNMPERHLTTPPIDCTGRTGVRLSFWRWLGVEQPLYDHARVRISNDGTTWTTVWENGTEIADTAWVFQAFDVSSIADNQPTVYVRWTMGPTDSGWHFCGWNIDDVSLSTFECTGD